MLYVASFWLYVDVQCVNVAVASFCAVCYRCSGRGVLGGWFLGLFVFVIQGLSYCFAVVVVVVAMMFNASIHLFHPNVG